MQGGFGNVFMGMWTTPWSDLDGLWSIGTVGGWGPVTSIIGRRETSGTAPNYNCANGHITGACDAVEGGGGVGHPFWRRFSNALFYQSPVINGLQGKFAFQTNEGKSTESTATTTIVKANPSAWSASVQWSGMGGAARVGAAYDSHKEFSSIGNTDTGYSIKGGYNLGMLDIGLAYEAMKYESLIGKCKGNNMGVALAFPIASGAIRGSWSKASDLNDAGCFGNGPAASPDSVGPGIAGDNGAVEMNIGYEHRFSKRTTVGFGYAAINNDKFGAHSWTGLPPNSQGAASTVGLGQDVSTFFVNMVHRF
jgi:predicted porin